ncbi:MAG: hypothetical protein EOO30_04755 [Comamonadaceae bacterium]|nr:MAG: hypothetical protein EOO30_04755 [Comamonadaceae bacterium]
MRHTARIPTLGAQHLRAAALAAAAAVTIAFAGPAIANPAQAAADRQFAQAVQFHKEGRHAPAFGLFIDLANRGDVDAARIALFMHQYGPMLYGKHWEAGREDVEYWTTLVRNSSVAGRQQPDFVPLAVVAKGKHVKQVRAPARPVTGELGNR